MSYQVIARKYRPQTFAEVVGQKHITQTLQNALAAGRMHHAYLFTGARGVGKTTVARILAKALNCAKRKENEPCNACAACLQVMEGRSIDVLEIDGASNTGVDDVRQIREQTKYMPAKGKYKIYIIDEVHMLSTQAFNALLKTLEEPPPHVIFIFATTEARKIPITILSRCQRFDFRHIALKDLAESLGRITEAEKIDCSPDALHILAQEAKGSLRDAQSLLDQAIAFSGKKIEYENLQKMFGFLDRTEFKNLVSSLLKKDRQAALDQFVRFYETGQDCNRLAVDLLELFRNLLLLKSLGEVPSWFELPEEEIKTLQELSALGTAEEFDQLFQLTYRGVQEIARSETPRMIFEVLLIRMTLVSKVVPLSNILDELDKLAGPAATPSANVVPQRSQTGNDWESFIRWLNQEKPQLAAVVKHGRVVKREGTTITLGFESDSIYAEMLKEEARKAQLREFLKKFYKADWGVELTLLQAATSSDSSSAEKKKMEREVKTEALHHEAVREAANILGATVEEIRTDIK